MLPLGIQNLKGFDGTLPLTITVVDLEAELPYRAQLYARSPHSPPHIFDPATPPNIHMEMMLFRQSVSHLRAERFTAHLPFDIFK